MKVKTYTVKRLCYSIEHSEQIRREIHDKFVRELYDKHSYNYSVTTQALYDKLNLTCIVKITVRKEKAI